MRDWASGGIAINILVILFNWKERVKFYEKGNYEKPTYDSADYWLLDVWRNSSIC